ncbi:MAG: CPBP family intramembrane metalloprotease [Solobacterium sp.]|nr:CPBP family intramembrane metalloprotease [Solobacterium sp.]
MSNSKNDIRSIAEKAVIVFLLGYGMHYFGYFIRARYYIWLDSLHLDPGIAHCLRYSGHAVFLVIMLVYALVVKGDRKYIFSFCHGKAGHNLKYALIGAAAGFCEMGACILAASLNENIVIRPSASVSVPIFILAFACVFVQASAEEIEDRGFVFGKMNSEGVPLVPAVLVSSFFFSYLHAANPGFGFLPLLSLLLTGGSVCSELSLLPYGLVCLFSSYCLELYTGFSVRAA